MNRFPAALRSAWLLILIACLTANSTDAAPTLPGEPCQVPPRSTWSETESWVWNSLCTGEIADLNEYVGANDGQFWLDTPSPEGWSARRLRPDFLEAILLHDPWQSAIPRQGVGIIGAWFEDDIDLENAQIRHNLGLGKSLFAGDLKLSGIRAELNLYLEHSAVNGELDLSNANIAGDLKLDSLEVMDLDLSSARVGGWVELSEGAKIRGELDMDTTHIGGDLLMRNGSEFHEVDMYDAHINGWLDLRGSTFAEVLEMESVEVGANILLDEAILNGTVIMKFAEIGGNLSLSNAKLGSFDLSGTNIRGELRMSSGKKRPEWRPDSRLALLNVRVQSLVDTIHGNPEADVWPAVLDLDGFVYQRLGGTSGDVDSDEGIAAIGSTWFIEWLEKDHPYSPQPYEQLAKVLRQMGHGEVADDVLYAGQERARQRAWKDDHWGSWTGQTLLKWTIGYGYGYRYFWSLCWILVLVLIGTVVLWRSGQNNFMDKDGHSTMRLGPFYALDMLLPIIELRKAHYDVDLEGPARYYFYFHKVMGYVLASFLIAGISGLTK